MSPGDLRALADRVEQATGPDRELDVDIEHARGWPDAQWTSDARRYTASLDAAVTLVPTGASPTFGQNVHHRYWGASINRLTPDGEVESVAWGQAHQPALALTAAALRALAAGKEGA